MVGKIVFHDGFLSLWAPYGTGAKGPGGDCQFGAPGRLWSTWGRILENSDENRVCDPWLTTDALPVRKRLLFLEGMCGASRRVPFLRASHGDWVRVMGLGDLHSCLSSWRASLMCEFSVACGLIGRKITRATTTIYGVLAMSWALC